MPALIELQKFLFFVGKAGSTLLSSLDEGDEQYVTTGEEQYVSTGEEQYVAISDPATNQEIMVPITHGNLGPFESLLAATEAAEEQEEGMLP